MNKQKQYTTLIVLITFLGLISFAIIWNTIKGQKMNNAYWGVIGSLIVPIAAILKSFFRGKKHGN